MDTEHTNGKGWNDKESRFVRHTRHQKSMKIYFGPMGSLLKPVG